MTPETPEPGRSIGHSRLYVALDTTDRVRARALADALAPLGCGIKLGLEFFCAEGPDGVRHVAATGAPLFLDLKLHDIPNTVAGGVRAVVPLGARLLTVHAAGGPAMMEAAAQTARSVAATAGLPRPHVIGVSVLTSLDRGDLAAVGVGHDVPDQVARLGALAEASGLDGMVCSPREVAMLRGVVGPDFQLIVPGIRPAGATSGDQKRVMTPEDAVAAGADSLVVGRPITQADDPVAAARRIMDMLPPAGVSVL
ncbi:orotidine-5'-phosphate decarboxylase [Yunchengibacter salinarum]|uniref:orotidine-5'-phosphate decarboxylase n=1 Tax=Yunchengibacter salinarum TaxID=3133399 RepID=UPI0035B5AB21